jgi:hypothetical protein
MPPSPDIGGRRWVKFAKHLKRSGHLVKIIAAKEYLPGVSAWERDGNELKSEITFLNSSYPKYLGLAPNNILKKLAYRASLSYVRRFTKGNYYDKSNHWKKELLANCQAQIEKYQIKNVICTIPPFRMAHILLELKSTFPNLNLIVDYRDPWTNNRTSFGFGSLESSRMDFEKKLEQEVIEGYDRILTVSQQMTDYFQQLTDASNLKNKCITLPNGFDREDFETLELKALSDPSENKINIVFAGTFYEKASYILIQVMEVLRELQQIQIHQTKVLQFIFIGSMPLQLLPYFKEHQKNFVFLGKKSLSETYSYIQAADYCSLFLTDDLNYSFSTKFYEYVALRKPILSFSKVSGANAEFIENKQLGLGVNFTNLKDRLTLLQEQSTTEYFVSNFDVSEFDVATLSSRIETVLVE